MYIQLMHRHYGIHSPVKRVEISCGFEEVCQGGKINEDILLKNIPDEWLPDKPGNILITIADEHGSTGQYKLKKFRSWAKYFDAYVLELWDKNPEEAHHEI